MRDRDLTGYRTGRLTVVGPCGPPRRKRKWIAACDYGNQITVRGDSLLRPGNTQSCGCLNSDNSKQKATRLNEKYRIRAAQIVAAGAKSCSKCNVEKPLSAFPAGNRYLDGHSPQCKECQIAKRIRRKYKTSVEAIHEIIEKQGGMCGNDGCNNKIPPGRNTHIDHDHETGEVRGVLCRGCNVALGIMRDSPNRILGLHRYAMKHRQLRLVRSAS